MKRISSAMNHIGHGRVFDLLNIGRTCGQHLVANFTDRNKQRQSYFLRRYFRRKKKW